MYTALTYIIVVERLWDDNVCNNNLRHHVSYRHAFSRDIKRHNKSQTMIQTF